MMCVAQGVACSIVYHAEQRAVDTPEQRKICMSPQTRPRVSHIGEIPQSLWECRTRKLDCHFQLLPPLLLPPLTHLPVSAPDKVYTAITYLPTSQTIQLRIAPHIHYWTTVRVYCIMGGGTRDNTARLRNTDTIPRLHRISVLPDKSVC